MFIQLGLSPADRNIVRYYLGAGLTCHGLLKKQVSDILGIAVAHTGLSEEYRKTNPVLKKYETTLEGTYQLVIGKNFNLQPALQYIINPGAIENVKNAFIGTLRFNLMF
jgi:porin